jgi:hypothetical protein
MILAILTNKTNELASTTNKTGLYQSLNSVQNIGAGSRPHQKPLRLPAS